MEVLPSWSHIESNLSGRIRESSNQSCISLFCIPHNRKDYACLPAQASHCILAYIDPFPSKLPSLFFFAQKISVPCFFLVDAAAGGAVLLQSFIDSVVVQVRFVGVTIQEKLELNMVDLFLHHTNGAVSVQIHFLVCANFKYLPCRKGCTSIVN